MIGFSLHRITQKVSRTMTIASEYEEYGGDANM